MKTKILTLAALFLASGSAAFAQPEEVSPTPTPRLGLRGIEPLGTTEPIVETETANRSYPRPGTPLTPKPTPKTAATATPPAARESALSPSPTATPRTTVRAIAPALPKNAVAAVRELEKRWATATKEHDTAITEGLLAADYIGITAAGNVVNKADLLAELRKDKNIYEAVSNDRPEVRIHGNTAIAVGTTKQKGKDTTGKEFNYTFRWTDTWVERDGTWQCVASQSHRQTR